MSRASRHRASAHRKMLLSTIMDPNARDRNGMTALHKACLIGDWDNATRMMKEGGDPLLVDDEGRNAMWFARCMLKGFTWAATVAFADGAGIRLAATNETAGMTDREALRIGKDLFDRSLAAEAGEVE